MLLSEVLNLSRTPHMKYDDVEGGYEVFDKTGKRADKFWHDRSPSDKKKAHKQALELLRKLRTAQA